MINKKSILILLSSIILSSNIYGQDDSNQKLNQFIETLKQLSEEKQKMNPYQAANQMVAEKEKKEQTIQDKMMKEQEIHQYIEMKQKYDPIIISDKIKVAIKSLQDIKNHYIMDNSIEIPYVSKYKIGNHTKYFVNKNELDRAINRLKNDKSKLNTIDMLINRLQILEEAIKNNKSLIITEDINQLLRNVVEIYQNKFVQLNNINQLPVEPSIPYNENMVLTKIKLNQHFSEGIKVKKIDDDSIVLGY